MPATSPGRSSAHPRLTNRPPRGTYRRADGVVPRGRSLARADLAHALLACLHDPATEHQTLGVAY